MKVLDGTTEIPVVVTNKIKVHVFGSETYDDYEFLEKTLNYLFPNGFFLISGGANGADQLSEIYLKKKLENETELNDNELIILPNWKLYPRFAGVKRNGEMVNISDIGVGFWDFPFGRGKEEIIIDDKLGCTKLTLLRSGTFDSIKRWIKTGKNFRIYIRFKNSGHLGFNCNINIKSLKHDEKIYLKRL